MNLRALGIVILSSALALAGAGCRTAPGKPKPADQATRPDEVLDFPTLYSQNCAACHGENGRNGAALSLANPVYLATAGVANIERVTAAGVPATMMPPFAKASGGMLTPQQISALAQGMISAWSSPGALHGQTPPPYAASSPGDAVRGQAAFITFCARCHGVDAAGMSSDKIHTGSLVEPAYLALITDQGLRSFILAGMPERDMPDWRSDAIGPQARPLNDQEIADIVAWIASHRTATPGQPYPQHH